jgi:formate dehydrogenase maturation protein FdhE
MTPLGGTYQREAWDRRIARAKDLAQFGPSRVLLTFYAGLLTVQRDAYEALRTRLGRAASGSLEQDLAVTKGVVPQLLQYVASRGPDSLGREARQLLEGEPEGIGDILIEYWHKPSDRQFFAKAALQPYACWLAEAGIAPIGRELGRADNRCPFCGGTPQLSILQTGGGSDGGGRLLLCAMCQTTWPFRRVVCASCGEEGERNVGYFHTPELDHVRVDACESCKRYLKTVDLTRLGLAVPLVDEVAGASLDLWARDQGFEKIELNLLGL